MLSEIENWFLRISVEDLVAWRKTTVRQRRRGTTSCTTAVSLVYTALCLFSPSFPMIEEARSFSSRCRRYNIRRHTSDPFPYPTVRFTLTLYALVGSDSVVGACCNSESCNDQLDDVCDPAFEQRSRLACKRQDGRVQRPNEGRIRLEGRPNFLEDSSLLLAVCGRGQRRAEEHQHLVRCRGRHCEGECAALRWYAFAGFVRSGRSQECSKTVRSLSPPFRCIDWTLQYFNRIRKMVRFRIQEY